jgi:ABC-type transporter Mla subunit MlaD
VPAKTKKDSVKVTRTLEQLLADASRLHVRSRKLIDQLKQLAAEVAENRAKIDDALARGRTP